MGTKKQSQGQFILNYLESKTNKESFTIDDIYKAIHSDKEFMTELNKISPDCDAKKVAVSRALSMNSVRKKDGPLFSIIFRKPKSKFLTSVLDSESSSIFTTKPKTFLLRTGTITTSPRYTSLAVK